MFAKPFWIREGALFLEVLPLLAACRMAISESTEDTEIATGQGFGDDSPEGLVRA